MTVKLGRKRTRSQHQEECGKEDKSKSRDMQEDKVQWACIIGAGQL
jgi:hypothetical protein